MMRWLILGICVVLQIAWSDLLSIQGRGPDLILLGIIWASAPLGGWRGALLGFVVGLGADLLGAQDPLGAGALAGTSAGFFSALFLDASQRLHPLRLLGRAALILAPLEIFLANLRYSGMDYQALQICLGLALPVWAYTLLLLGLLFWLPGHGRTRPSR